MCCCRSARARPHASFTRPLGPSPAPCLPGASPPAPSQAGANINAVDKQQRTPLMEAVVNNHLEVARYMVQRGGCVYSKVCMQAAGRGPGVRDQVWGASRRLICPCLPQEEDGSTCLHHAAKIGNLEMVSLLLSTGQVDVNAQVSGPPSTAPPAPWCLGSLARPQTLGPLSTSDLWPFHSASGRLCLSPLLSSSFVFLFILFFFLLLSLDQVSE